MLLSEDGILSVFTKTSKVAGNRLKKKQNKTEHISRMESLFKRMIKLLLLPTRVEAMQGSEMSKSP